ncbi:hypothetical protein L2U69_16145 [Zavarzinia compransoris]|uniref:hypothetical protein n=1 Tax=Zavarzinia marina TaxID=2911065 RepID=UPI001F35248C|nr:hypothetical protein [Zavarzinia marina]MCF4167180.1 hypothetical protein [Zavarzinia marina]
MIARRFLAKRGLALVVALPLLTPAMVGAQQAQGPDDPDRPPLLSAPPPGGITITRPAAPEDGVPIQTDPVQDFFTQYPPEVVPPSATQRPFTNEGSSAVK